MQYLLGAEGLISNTAEQIGHVHFCSHGHPRADACLDCAAEASNALATRRQQTEEILTVYGDEHLRARAAEGLARESDAGVSKIHAGLLPVIERRREADRPKRFDATPENLAAVREAADRKRGRGEW